MDPGLIDRVLMKFALIESDSQFEEQLAVILGAVAQVAEVAADDIPATSHPMPLVNVFREDVVRPTLTNEEALSGAPSVESERFRVPRILDEE